MANNTEDVKLRGKGGGLQEIEVIKRHLERHRDGVTLIDKRLSQYMIERLIWAYCDIKNTVIQQEANRQKLELLDRLKEQTLNRDVELMLPDHYEGSKIINDYWKSAIEQERKKFND